MRAVVQRVSRAEVTVAAEPVGAIGPGLVALVGAEEGDGPEDVAYVVDKLVNLRVFEDDAGKMNRSVLEVGGALLLVSQFTLLGDARKGRRPAFTRALEPVAAQARYEEVVAGCRAAGAPVETGRFRASMSVALVNEGPVTLLLDSRRQF